jgi:hypothetical protein
MLQNPVSRGSFHKYSVSEIDLAVLSPTLKINQVTRNLAGVGASQERLGRVYGACSIPQPLDQRLLFYHKLLSHMIIPQTFSPHFTGSFLFTNLT